MTDGEDGQRDGQERPTVDSRLTGGCYVAPVRPRTGTKVLAGRGHLGRADDLGALVVDRLDRADHQLDAEAVVDEVVAGPARACRRAGGRSAAG